MALKIFKFDNGTDMQTAIETNTGIRFDKTYENMGRGVYNTAIKFPSMDNYVTLPITWLSYTDGYTGIADEENGYLFILHTGAWTPDTQIANALFNLIYMKDGELKSFIETSASVTAYMSTVLMLDDKYNKHDSSVDSFELVPVSTCGPDIIPNVYCEYKRRFDSGLRFIDQNGNKWVTLGGYMLYHYE